MCVRINRGNRGVINRELIQSESMILESGQLLFVAITLEPNGFNRFASSIPMLPYPKINTCSTERRNKPL